ncbi:HIT family hydrolase [Candidatus Fermentibacteria bacterium]|nr:MAG: HIT family hydrolase [Candidatus Fermentibacteria bacterium]
MTDRLWAPWRYDYVSSPEEKGRKCVFCSIASDDSRNDRKNLVLFRGEKFFVVLNRYPYINGHLMIVPCRHISDMGSLDNDEMSEMMALVKKAENALRKGMKCQGMNGGWNMGSAGGAGIPGHLHIHMLPRWGGDTNFMTTVGGIRVVSQSLEKALEILTPLFRESC